MTDILFPPGLAPRRVTWTLERAVATFDSPLSFASQRVARAGARWRASIEMPPLDQAETGLLSSWLDQISRANNCGIVPVFQNDRSDTESDRSTFANPQPNWREPGALAPWSSLNLNPLPRIVDGRVALTAVAGGPARIARGFDAITNLPYSVIVDVPVQFQPGAIVITTNDGSPILFDNRSAPAAGLFVIPVSTDDTRILVNLYAGDGSIALVTSYFGDVRVVRNYVVQSAATAGANVVTFTGGDSALDNPFRNGNIVRTLRPGQFINVRTAAGVLELKRVQQEAVAIIGGSLNGVAGITANGRLVIEPPLRNALAANDRIVTDMPVCRMRLAEPNSSATIDAPMFGGFAFDLVEWFGA